MNFDEKPGHERLITGALAITDWLHAPRTDVERTIMSRRAVAPLRPATMSRADGQRLRLRLARTARALA